MSAKKEGLLLILHGSPRIESNQPADQLAEKIYSSGRFHHVMLAYMECNHPTIPEAVQTCASMGVEHLIAVPYMLHNGRHLVLDVPNIVIKAAQVYPEMLILLTDPVGYASGVSDSLMFRAREAAAN